MYTRVCFQLFRISKKYVLNIYLIVLIMESYKKNYFHVSSALSLVYSPLLPLFLYRKWIILLFFYLYFYFHENISTYILILSLIF